MASRLHLQTELEKILGVRNVYFQPPSSIKMRYPAIRYGLSRIDISHADDSAYKQDKAYALTLIDEDPESVFVSKILAMQKCSFDRFYVSDNLNHWAFTLYY